MIAKRLTLRAAAFSLLGAGTLLSGCTTLGAISTAAQVAQVAIPAMERQNQRLADRREPVTLLISIDGFKPDYLKRGVTPNLNALAANGVFARMRPSFPSKTFPNHYTIVTGKRPDNNGIVGNNMVDPRRPDAKDAFSLGNAKQALDPFWWDEAEPIWVTAQKQNVRTATMFWPGSEVAIHDHRPQDWDRFDQNISNRQRIDAVVDWLRRPASNRPKFLTVYFDIVDTAGHTFGPDAAETSQAVADVDTHIGMMMRDIAALGQPVNVVMVSDHGMAAVTPERMVDMDKWLPRDAYRLITSGTYAGLEPLPGKAGVVEAALIAKQPHPNVHCYAKGKLPAELHYGRNPRVPSVLCLADVGWEITQGVSQSQPKGDHGYDPAHPDMHATFIASGPAFQRGKTLAPFDNVEIYGLLTRMIGIQALPYDGKGTLAAEVLAKP